MYLLEYRDNNFYMNYYSDEYNDPNIFQEKVGFLKSLYLGYDGVGWKVQKKTVDEILSWFEYYSVDYSITDEAQKELGFLYNDKKSQLTFYRRRSFDPSVLNKNVTLYDYQKFGVEWRLSRNVYLDANDTGTGKTLMNISVFSDRYFKGEIDGIIILTPNGLSYHWKKEILAFTNLFTPDDIVLINNKNKHKLYEQNVECKILIIPNHLFADTLLSYRPDFKNLKSKKNLRWNNSVNILEKWNKNALMLIADESHNFKNSTAVRTKALLSVSSQFKYKALVTATPAINRIEDFYAQIKILDENFIKMSENAFKLWLAKSIGNNYNRYTITKYHSKNVQTFLSSLEHIMTRVLKEDLPEMGVERFRKPVILEIDKLQQSIYRAVADYEISILKEEYDTITAQLIINKLPLLTEAVDNPYLLLKREYTDSKISSLLSKWDLSYDVKFQYLKYRIENQINNDDKLIVYGYHPETLDLLYDKFKKYNPLIIHGQRNTEDDERRDIEELFNFDKERKIIFLSSLTSSAGINLQYGGNYILVYENPFDATRFAQLQDRTHRIVSKRNSIVEIPYYDNTIDAVRLNRVLNRTDLNENLNKPLSDEKLKKLLNGIV